VTCFDEKETNPTIANGAARFMFHYTLHWSVRLKRCPDNSSTGETQPAAAYHPIMKSLN
jgi:hypothetical protein